MGANLSSAHTIKNCVIFESPELNEGSRQLSNDHNIRTAFLNFIKSGIWLDSIIRVPPIFKKDTMSEEERLAFENKNPIYLYKTAPSKPVDFQDKLSSAGKSSVWLTNPRCTLSSDPLGPNETRKHAVENITTGTTPCTSHPSLADFGDCYVSLQNLGYFAQSQLISIMFGILYPIFLQIPNKEEFLQCETEVEETAENENATEPCVFTKSSRRAQESCAANFDETQLYQHLKLADWVDVIAEALTIILCLLLSVM